MKSKTILKKITIVVVPTLLAFLYITQFGPSNEAEAPILSKYGLDNLSVKEMVNKLDSNIDKNPGLNATITGMTLILNENEVEYDYTLPSDEFYVSVAPYINEVHPCKTHNLVSCRGEIFNKEFEVSIVREDGIVILSQKAKSMNSGFIGLWLPKGIEAILTIKYNGLSVARPISTFDNSDTCITTPLKLS
ncbi:MAG: CueP family metal-binding protein [Erysipelotrichaceae bacterium]|nr:CueP family metal-binding protein [Erysipelotrichaceae bacterium]